MHEMSPIKTPLQKVEQTLDSFVQNAGKSGSTRALKKELHANTTAQALKSLKEQVEASPVTAADLQTLQDLDKKIRELTQKENSSQGSSVLFRTNKIADIFRAIFNPGYYSNQLRETQIAYKELDAAIEKKLAEAMAVAQIEKDLNSSGINSEKLQSGKIKYSNIVESEIRVSCDKYEVFTNDKKRPTFIRIINDTAFQKLISPEAVLEFNGLDSRDKVSSLNQSLIEIKKLWMKENKNNQPGSDELNIFLTYLCSKLDVSPEILKAGIEIDREIDSLKGLEVVCVDNTIPTEKMTRREEEINKLTSYNKMLGEIFIIMRDFSELADSQTK